jgi:hypothetical protein
LTIDLTNFGSLVSALRHGNDPLAGGSQTPQITGVGAALGNLDQSSKHELKNLLKPDDHKH